MKEKIYRITDFSGGFYNDDDFDSMNIPDNSGVQAQNVISRPGALISRKTNGNVLINLTAPTAFGEFKLFGASNAVQRFLLVWDGTSFVLYVYSGGYSASTAHTDANGGTYSATDIPYIISIKNALRIGMWCGYKDVQGLAAFFGYINGRNFFNNAQTFTGWYEQESKTYPPGTPTLGTGTSGSYATLGKYFIVLTYEYDGYQEGWYSGSAGGAAYAAQANADAQKTAITAQITLDYSTLNKRITAVNVYCAYAQSSGAARPDTAYYHIGRIDINDSNWAVVSGTQYRITISLERDSTVTADGLFGGTLGVNDFPAAYYSTDFDTGISSGNIVEELYTRNGAVAGSNSVSYGRVLYGYSNHVWINGRHFVTRPVTPATSQSLIPYDERQVVLFSNFDKPDVFDWDIDYIDVSTTHGDEVTGLSELFGDLLIFKEYSLFRVSFNNSGNVFNWQVTESYLDVGCIAPNSIAKGNGVIFFCGRDNIYAFDGSRTRNLTNRKIKTTYQGYLTQTYSTDSDYDSIYGVFDPLNNRYLVNFPSVTGNGKVLVYSIDDDSWFDWQWEAEQGDVTYAKIGINNAILGIQGTSIIQLEENIDGDEPFTAIWKSKHTDLNGNPFQEKRIKWIKGQIANTDLSTSLKVYVNKSGTAAETLTISSQSEGEFYKECSHVGKIFQFEFNTGAVGDNNSAVFELKDFEVGYEEMPER